MKAFACMIVIGKLYRFDACLAQTKITNIYEYFRIDSEIFVNIRYLVN